MIHHYEIPDYGRAAKNPGSHQMLYFDNTEVDSSRRSQNTEFMKLHTHEDRAEIAFVYMGRGVHKIAGKTYYSEPGDILIYNQGVEHEDQARPGETVRFFVAAIKNLQLSGRPAGFVTYNNDNCMFDSGNYYNFIQRGFEAIEDCLVVQSPTVTALSNGFLTSLLAIMEEISDVEEEDVVMAPLEDLAEQIRAHIEQHYAENFTLEELSQEFEVSRYYAAHIFSRAFGVSPMKYRTKVRVREAKRLLEDSEYNISYVAKEVGYDDPNRFSQVFSKEVGQTPSRYRKSLYRSSYI